MPQQFDAVLRATLSQCILELAYYVVNVCDGALHVQVGSRSTLRVHRVEAKKDPGKQLFANVFGGDFDFEFPLHLNVASVGTKCAVDEQHF